MCIPANYFFAIVMNAMYAMTAMTALNNPHRTKPQAANIWHTLNIENRNIKAHVNNHMYIQLYIQNIYTYITLCWLPCILSH